jgi:hypothetical protein
MEIRYPGMVDAGKLTQTPLGRALERQRETIAPKKFQNLTKAKVRDLFHAQPSPLSNLQQRASSFRRWLSANADGSSTTQITKIFKQYAATNPMLNEKLEEFLTMAAVVRVHTSQLQPTASLLRDREQKYEWRYCCVSLR